MTKAVVGLQLRKLALNCKWRRHIQDQRVTQVRLKLFAWLTFGQLT